MGGVEKSEKKKEVLKKEACRKKMTFFSVNTGSNGSKILLKRVHLDFLYLLVSSLRNDLNSSSPSVTGAP